jgi:hypothetical protein
MQKTVITFDDAAAYLGEECMGSDIRTRRTWGEIRLYCGSRSALQKQPANSKASCGAALAVATLVGELVILKASGKPQNFAQLRPE